MSKSTSSENNNQMEEKLLDLIYDIKNAISKGPTKIETVRKLLTDQRIARYPDPSTGSLLFYAIYENNTEACKHILTFFDAESIETTLVISGVDMGITALLYALIKEDESPINWEIVELLLTNGANLEACTCKGASTARQKFMRATNVPHYIKTRLNNAALSKHKTPKKASHQYNLRSHAKNPNETEAKAPSKQAPSEKALHLYGLRNRNVSKQMITAKRKSTDIKTGEEENNESPPLLNPTCF
jgi:ankyrin repeat protein